MLTSRPPNLHTLPPLQLQPSTTQLPTRPAEMASPPTKNLSFSSNSANVTLPGIHSLLTPPNSGHTGRLKDSFDAHEEGDVGADPQMFSNDDLESSASTSQAPLFPSESFELQLPADLEEKLEAEEREYIQNYMSTYAPDWEKWEAHTGLPRPNEDDYYLMWSFIRTFRRDSENQAPVLDRKLRLTISKRESSPSRDHSSKSKKRKALQDTSPNRRTATNIAPKAPATPTLTPGRAKTDSPHIPRPRKRSVKAAEDAGGEPKQKAARAKASKPETSHDFQDYPDWAPSSFEIENPRQYSQSVKRFSGGYNDLSNDPNRHLLHPVEVEVAEHLSLNCAKYLCAKRQIFKGYVDLLVSKAEAKRRGETHSGNWNKTAVQQLGNVDVNKMSSLFTFFKDVGWFKEERFVGLVNELVQQGHRG